MNTDILHALIKTPFDHKQSGNTLKFEEKKKTRLLVKRGVAHISILLNNIALIYTKDKLVYAIDRDSKKYSIDKTLTELAEELDHSIFLRANRQYILNLNFIKSFKTYNKVKLIYAPGIVSFDPGSQLKYVGLESKGKTGLEAFEMIVPPLNYEIHGPF